MAVALHFDSFWEYFFECRVFQKDFHFNWKDFRFFTGRNKFYEK